MASHAANLAIERTGVGGAQQTMMGFVPQIWSSRTMKALDDKSLFLPLVNRDFEGEIKGKGDTVRIHHVGNIVAKSYAVPAGRGGALVGPGASDTSRGSITYQTATGASMLFTIDAADYFAFEVEDIEAAQADPKYVANLTARAGVALAQSTDRYILDKMITASSAGADEFDQAGSGGTELDFSASSYKVYDDLVDVGIILDDNLCPEDGRFIVLPTFALASLLKDDRFVGAAADGSGRMRDKGYIGTVAGFQIHTLSRKTFQKYETGKQSTQVLADATTTVHPVDAVYANTAGTGHPNEDTYKGIAGVKDAFTFADQISKTENVRLEGSFADGVRGLHVYGGKAIRPQWLHHLDCIDTIATVS
jgi:hypothetical protein